MSGADEMPDDKTLRRLARGNGSASEDVTYAQALAMEVLRLRERVARAETARDDAGDAYDVLVRRVWEAATGDTHEGPASVEVLLEAVVGLRARADGAEAKHAALCAAAREHLGATRGIQAIAEDGIFDARVIDAVSVRYERAAKGLRALAGEG